MRGRAETGERYSRRRNSGRRENRTQNMLIEMAGHRPDKLLTGRKPPQFGVVSYERIFGQEERGGRGNISIVRMERGYEGY